MSRRAKWLATLTMSLCAVLLFAVSPLIWVAITATAIMTCVCTWLWLRPEPDHRSPT